ncbi:SRSO17 transposase [Bradyrhizobium sp. GM5.1]
MSNDNVIKLIQPGIFDDQLTDVGFATKPKLATKMIARVIAASVPFKWVAGDTVYGVGDIEQQLRRAGKGYVLGAPKKTKGRPPAKAKA